MDDRGALADDLPVGNRDNPVMARFGELGVEAIGTDRFIEDFWSDAGEQRSIRRSDATEFNFH